MGTQLKPETLVMVKDAADGGCSMCRMTLQSITPENVLSDYPRQDGLSDLRPLYPADAQKSHISGWNMKGHGPWASRS